MLNVRFREKTNTWPGFVDLFSNMVIILIFLLIVFVFLWTTTSVFNRAQGARTIAELRQTTEEQTRTIQQITADTQEARRQLLLSQSEVETLTLANNELADVISELDLSIQDLVTAYEGKVSDLNRQLAAAVVAKEKMAELEQERRAMQAKSDAERAQKEAELSAQRDELENQLADMREQSTAETAELEKLRAALDAANAERIESDARYVEMSNELNKALADKVAELNGMAKYQSAFYRAISTALDGATSVRPDGDRFIVPSDILFPSGSYKLSAEGKNQLRIIANAIKEFEAQIPSDVNWIIRIDGHTDNKPVIAGTRGYANNTELSLKRASAVADELVRDGVLPRRLVPSGFGDTYPVAAGDDAASLQKNRRIELQLTNR